MAENTPKLAYLLSPTFQIENKNGKPIVGGWIEVFLAGTDTKYITYQNFDWTQNPFKIPLGSDGRAVVLAETEQAYDFYVRDSYGNLVFSRLNVAPGGAGGVAFGMSEVYHDDTLTGKGTKLSPIGVSPLTNLAVDDTMTAYEATVDGKEALVLGVNGDWFSGYYGSAWAGKVDTSAFEDCCSSVRAELDTKLGSEDLNNYYNKTETMNIFLPRSGYTNSGDYYTTAQTFNKTEISNIFDSVTSNVDSMVSSKKDKQTEIVLSSENQVITALIQNENGELSALYGEGGGGGSGEDTPWITAWKTIYPDTVQLSPGSVVISLSSIDVSGYKNHAIGAKGGAYRLPDEYSIANSLYSISAFPPVSDFNAATGSISGALWYLSGNINGVSAWAGDISAALNTKLDKSDSAKFYPMTGNPSGFLTAHQSLSNYYTKNETSSKEQISAAIAAIPVGDAQVNNAVHTYSGQWFNVSSKLDKSAFDAYTGTDNTYYMQGGNGIGVSSNDVLKETTIYFTGATADNNVNTAVRTYSSQWFAVSGKLDKSFSSTVYAKTDTSSKQQISAAIANIPSGITLPITAWNSPSGYSANITPSSFKLNWAANTTAGNLYTAVYIDVTGITRDYYPGRSQSVGWDELIRAATPTIGVACFNSTATRSMYLPWNKISGISSIKLVTPLYDNPDWGGGYDYSAFFYGPGEVEVGHVEIKPNCDVTVVRAISGFGSNTAKYWAREYVKYDSVHDVFNTVKGLLFPIQ